VIIVQPVALPCAVLSRSATAILNATVQEGSKRQG